MNRDVVAIIDRNVHRYCAEELNKQYMAKCVYSDKESKLNYYYNEQRIAYNFRVYDAGRWHGSWIYDLRFKKIAELPKNY